MQRLIKQNNNDFYASGYETLEKLKKYLPRLDKGDRILEPSAGNGRISDMLKSHYADHKISAWDINPSADGITKRNFLTTKCKKKFDLIVMNPPWSKQEYKKHIVRAFDFLSRTRECSEYISYYTELYVICPRFHKRNYKENDMVREEFDWLTIWMYDQIDYLCDVDDFECVDAKGRLKKKKLNACIYRFIVAR